MLTGAIVAMTRTLRQGPCYHFPGGRNCVSITSAPCRYEFYWLGLERRTLGLSSLESWSYLSDVVWVRIGVQRPWQCRGICSWPSSGLEYPRRSAAVVNPTC